MFAVGDADEGGSGFALRASSEDDYLFAREGAGFIHRDHRIVWHVQVAHLPGYLHVVHHAPSDHGNLAAILHGRIYDLLHPRDQRGERSDHDPPVGLADLAAERLAYYLLRRSVAIHFGVGRVRAQEEDAFVRHLRESGEVGWPSVHRGVVDLEIASVDDDPNGRSDGDAHGVGYGVAYSEELDS